MIQTITDHGPALGIRALCTALQCPRATYYRQRQPRPPRRRRRAPPARALSPTEQQQVLAVLHAPRFADQAPGQVYATLLDEGTYLCSERTMYRVLAGAGEVRELVLRLMAKYLIGVRPSTPGPSSTVHLTAPAGRLS